MFKPNLKHALIALSLIGVAHAEEVREPIARSMNVIQLNDVTFQGAPFLASTAKELEEFGSQSASEQRRADLTCAHFGYGTAFLYETTLAEKPARVWFHKETGPTFKLKAEKMTGHSYFEKIICHKKGA